MTSRATNRSGRCGVGLLHELKPVKQNLPGDLSAGLTFAAVTVLTLYGSLFFAAARSIEEMLPAPGTSRRAAVVLVLRGQSEVGNTFIQVLQRYAQSLKARGGRLLLAGVDAEVANQLRRTGALAVIGEAGVFLATPRLGDSGLKAYAEAEAWLGQSLEASPGTSSQ